MLVFEDAEAVGSAFIMRFNSDSSAAYDYLTLATATIASVTGAANFALAPDGVSFFGTVIFQRTEMANSTNQHSVLFNLHSGAVGDTLAFYRGSWAIDGAITAVNFLATTSLAGQVHVYRLANQ